LTAVNQIGLTLFNLLLFNLVKPVLQSKQSAFIKTFIFGHTMISPRSKSYYLAAIIIGLATGLATRDMPVGILLAVVLMILFSGLRKRND
jgi:hypothetical protein